MKNQPHSNKVIVYNSQRDNYNFGGRYSGFRQCFSTCAWMLMSYYSKRIQADNDKQLSWYVDQVEATVGVVGIAEKVRQYYQYVRGKTSQWWVIQRAGIEIILRSHNIKGSCVFSEKASWDDLSRQLKQGPVILGTRKFGGLKGGHIILLLAETRKGYYAHDPFGEAINSKYTDHDGCCVFYSREKLSPHAQIAKGKRLRMIYWDKGEK